jgi:hypothetical protein
MKNEFEKLDTFMREHRPESSTSRSAPTSRSHFGWHLPVGITACLVAIFVTVFQVQQRQQELDLEAIAMMETLEWEMSDETLADVTDLVAIVD